MAWLQSGLSQRQGADVVSSDQLLKMLMPDIFLGAHAEWFSSSHSRKREFEDQVDLELGVKK